MHAATDESLVARIAKGEQVAMQVLFARHNVRVFRFVLRYIRDEATAEDVVSDVFLDVWKQAGRFEGRSAVSTWLLGMARFKALSARRANKDTVDADDALAEHADDADTPEVEAQKRDKGAALRACIDKLSSEHREIIDLVYYHEKPIKEIAEILKIPDNTVKTRMFYARKKLSELMSEAGIDRGWP